MNKIVMATKEDKEEILDLYKTMLFGPAEWDEHYPSVETIEYDLSRDALFVVKNIEEQIIATISLDYDKQVDDLLCWNQKIAPGGEVSRICVRKDMQKKGILKAMMQHACETLKIRGMKSIQLLVLPKHIVAIESYKSLEFEIVGSCRLFGKYYLCMEKKI